MYTSFLKSGHQASTKAATYWNNNIWMVCHAPRLNPSEQSSLVDSKGGQSMVQGFVFGCEECMSQHGPAIRSCLLILLLTACNSSEPDGLVSPSPTTSPQVILPVKQISIGYEFACALTTGGNIECWGYNGWGQAGAPARTYTANSSTKKQIRSRIISCDYNVVMYNLVARMSSLGFGSVHTKLPSR